MGADSDVRGTEHQRTTPRCSCGRCRPELCDGDRNRLADCGAGGADPTRPGVGFVPGHFRGNKHMESLYKEFDKVYLDAMRRFLTKYALEAITTRRPKDVSQRSVPREDE